MYAVGYMEGLTSDPERQSWTSDAPRPLAWTAWYPTPPGTQTKEKLLGPTGSEIFRIGVVAENAELSSDAEQWPVVLLSHGTGGSARDLGWLGGHLAAKGFICLGVSHHGNTAIEPYLPEGFLCWWERAHDLTVILDWFASQGPLANRVDLSHVFAAGFSLGGYTAFALAGAISNMDQFQDWLATKAGSYRGPREFPDLADYIPRLLAESTQFQDSFARHANSYLDRRIQAIATFAPAPTVRAFEPDSVEGIAIPVQITVGRDDQEAPHDECSLWLQQHNPNFDVKLLGSDVGHYVFLPEATEAGKKLEPSICIDPDGVERRAIHVNAAQATEQLFRGVIEKGLS